MEARGVRYDFEALPWRYEGKAAWHFVSMPAQMADEVRGYFGNEEQGWGRLKATARIGNTEWATAIWYDTKAATYLLPIKADIRRKEQIEVNRKIAVSIWI